MFDTPDLSPLCFAPFVSLVAGLFIYMASYLISSTITKRTTKKKTVSLIIAIILMPIVCIASIALRISPLLPSPLFAPRSGNVVGTWVFDFPTKKALNDWHQVDVISHELVFLKDGTFYIENIPSFGGFSDSDYGSENKYIDGYGKWKFDRLQGYERLEWIIHTEFIEINGKPDNRDMRYYFEGHLPPYKLVTLDGRSLIFHFKRMYDLDISLRNLLLWLQ